MPHNLPSSFLLATALCAGALAAGGPASGLGTTTAPRADVQLTTLTKTAVDASLVTTDRGVSVAMWVPEPKSSTRPTTRLEWSVQRPGEAWSTPRTLANWRVSPYKHGLPQLATASGHRVTAAWLDKRRRVVVENWGPRHGWSRPTHLSGLGQRARSVVITSNVAGRVAVSWSQVSRAHTDQAVPAMVGVRRDGTWLVRSAGEEAPDIHSVGLPVLLGIDADGAVTAAWRQLSSGRGPSLVTRITAGGSDFETPAVFAQSYSLALVVQPDGSAMLDPEADTASGVFTRLDDGPWVSAGDLPFASNSLTTPDGALVTWPIDSGIAEDPDGIAGPQPLAIPVEPGFPVRAHSLHVMVTAAGDLVAVAVLRHDVYFSVRSGGAWSAVQTAFTFPRLIRDAPYASMSPDGHVTMLLATHAPGAHINRHLRLDTIGFDAT